MILRRRRAPSVKLPKAILFDALGTLIELEPPAPKLRDQLEQRFGLHVTVAEADRAIAAEIAYYREHFDDGANPDELIELRRRCVLAMRDELPLGTADIPVEALTEVLLSSIGFRVFPDVGFALGSARTRGVRLIVVSNWDVSLHEVLTRLGVAPLLHGVVTSAEYGARKPDPSIFAGALDLAGVSADKALHVGDSIENDIEGARAAGIEPVLIRRDGTPGPPGTRTIANLLELFVT